MEVVYNVEFSIKGNEIKTDKEIEDIRRFKFVISRERGVANGEGRCLL